MADGMGSFGDVTVLTNRDAGDPTSARAASSAEAPWPACGRRPRSDPLDVLIVGGGVVGCGAALDAAARGTVGRPGRGRRPRDRHVEPLLAAGPRRAALPGAAASSRSCTRPSPSAGCCWSGWPRTWSGPCPSCCRCQRRRASAPTWGPGWRSTTCSRGSAPTAARCRARAPCPGGGARAGPGPAGGGDGGGGALPRRPDRRRPATSSRWRAPRPARGAAIATGVRVVGLLRSEREEPAARRGRRGFGRGRPASRHKQVTGALVHDGDRGADRRPRPGRALRRRGVDRRPRRDGDGHGGARAERAAQQGRAPGGARGAAFRSTTAVIARTPLSRAVPAAVERALAGRHHRHRRHGQPRDPRASPARTSTTCSARPTAGWLGRWCTEDVVGVYAGLRPLLSAGQGETTQLSREHAVMRPVPGFVAIAGGKYTTYRVMAADAVDAVVEQLPGPVGPSTHRPRSPWSAPRASASSGRVGCAARADRRPRGGGHRTAAAPARGPHRGGARPDRGGSGRWPNRCTRTAGSSGPRRSSPPATRAARIAGRHPGAAHPAGRADPRPRPERRAGRPPSWWRPSSAGTTARIEAEIAGLDAAQPEVPGRS